MTVRPVSTRWAAMAALLAFWLGGCAGDGGGGGASAAAGSPLSLAQTLGDQRGDEQFARVTGPPALAFPADHGPHPDYRQEWWYFTGHLQATDGRRFGFQVTFFRFALAAGEEAGTGDSAWHAAQVYMAHFAVSDLDGNVFHARQRLARGGAMGLAGARGDPLEVWVEGWRMATLAAPAADAPAAADVASPFAVAVSAQGDGVGLELELHAARPPVLQGVDGYSRKGDAPDNASAYYSITRLDAAGELRIGGERLAVRGTSWFDREWGTSFLAPGIDGWDWFSLQLDDGRDLMFYRLRRDDGTSSPWSAGTLVTPATAGGDAQRVRRLEAGDVALEPRRWWRSPSTGVRYPVAWRLAVADADLELEVRAAMDAQELDLAARYWEGAVEVSGTGADGAAVGGRGYLELAGY